MNRRLWLSCVGSVCACAAWGGPPALRVRVWDEQQPEQKQGYDGRFLGDVLADHLRTLPGLAVTQGHPGQAESGLAEADLDATDVVVWWSHRRNAEVPDALAERVVSRVHGGRMGLIALHSAHWAKPFVRLMQERAKADAQASLAPAEREAWTRVTFSNTQPIGRMVRPGGPVTPQLVRGADGALTLFLPGCIFPAWRNDGQPSHVTTRMPDHPLAAGLPAAWDIPRTEMYAAPFHVPAPDAVVMEERWDKGETFPSCAAWTVGEGRVVYFRPGHETYPVYRQAEPLRVVENAIRWTAPAARR